MSTATAQDILALKNKVIQAVLDITANQSWSDISLQDIAQKLNVDVRELAALFPDKINIIGAYARQIDLRLENEFQGQSGDESRHDRLFDIFMERFDMLDEHKLSIISIVNAVTLDPKQALSALPFLSQSMIRVATICGVDTKGWKGALMITALTGVYIKTLRDWINDESDDMAATMASLDKNLGYLDKINF